MDDRRCEICRFWKPADNFGQTYTVGPNSNPTHRIISWGICRFGPPVYAADGEFLQPSVQKDDWCGKWEGMV